MRWLIGGLTAVVAVWGTWWWVAARGLERGAVAWFDGQAAAGLDARLADASVIGFPARLDLTVTGPELADPTSGWGWTAPFAQLLTLAYKPWHVIVALPPDQTIRTPAGDWRLASSRLRASVVAAPSPALPLERIAVEGDGLRLDAGGAVLSAEALRAGTRRDAADPLRHAVAAALTGIVLPGPQPPEAPEGTAALRIDAALTFTAPLDRHAGAAPPGLAAVEVADARFAWGPLAMAATGRVARDAAGFAEGRLTLTVADWPRALALAVAAGLVDPGVAPTLGNAAQALSDAAGTPGRAALPVTFRGGRTLIGPVPVGAAPRL